MTDIIARLREPLSDQQIERLATEVLSQRPTNSARVLFEALNRDPGEELVTNVLSLFQVLAKRSSTWVTLLEKSVKKKGRCPKPLISSVRGLLHRGRGEFASHVRSVRELLADLETAMDSPVREKTTQRRVKGAQITRKTTFFRSGKLRATVAMTQELSDIAHMESVAGVLADIPPSTDEVEFDFAGVDHIYVVGLTALAAWCSKYRKTPEIVNASETTLKYLDVIGFAKVSRGGISPYKDIDPSFGMAIEDISSESQPESVASKLVTIIDEQMSFPQTTRQGLIVVFAELVENIQRHAGSGSAAFACAQVYPRRRKLTICVADTGIGIKESILTSSNEGLVRRIEQGESPVELACAPLVTSKPEKHSGYGLYVASELAVRNGGTFRMFSGNEVFTRYRKGWQKRESLTRVSDPWNGTWVAMILDLDATISVGDVYVTLPPAPGTELEDFF